MELVGIAVILVIALLAAVVGIRVGILVAHRLDRRLAADEEERRDGAERGG